MTASVLGLLLVTAGTALANLPLGGSGSPALAVNPLNPDNIAVASRIELRVSTDGGTTFGPPVLAPIPETHQFEYIITGTPEVAFDSQGRLFWLYRAATTDADGFSSQGDLFLVQADPTTGAILPGYPVDVAAAAGFGSVGGSSVTWYGYSLAADAEVTSPYRDHVYVLWSNYLNADNRSVQLTTSTDAGVTWTTAVQLGGTNATERGPTDLAIAPNGDVYAAFHLQPLFLSGEPAGTSGRQRVFRSTDGGATFPQNSLAFPAGLADMTYNYQYNFATRIAGCRMYLLQNMRPTVLVDPLVAGRIHVVTADDPDNDPTSGDPVDIFVATSTDHGVSWGSPQRVDDMPGTGHTLFPTAAIAPTTGEILFTWYDPRDGGLNPNGYCLYDLYGRRGVYDVGTGGIVFPGPRTDSFRVNQESWDPEGGAQCMGGCAGWYTGIWGTGPSDIWAAGVWPTGGNPNASHIVHFDGSTWSPVTTGLSGHYQDIWGASATDIFAVALNGQISHYDGVTWTNLASGTSAHLGRVWGSSGSDVFAVGAGGTIVHWDGSACALMASGTTRTLFGISGTGPTDVFAVGGQGTVMHWDGFAWTPMAFPTSEFLMDIEVFGTDDAIAVGVAGGVYRYDGTWSLMARPTNRDLRAIWGTSSASFWTVASGGIIVQWDGSAWTTSKPTDEYFWTVWGTGDSNVLAAGLQYAMFRWNGTDWIEEDDPFGPRPVDLTVYPPDGNTVVGSGNGFLTAWTGNRLDPLGGRKGSQTFFLSPVGTGVSPLAFEPGGLMLEPGRPNPFGSVTELSFRVPADGAPAPTSLRIYDAAGRLVRELLNAPRGPGRHTVRWDGTDSAGHGVANGVYFGRLQWGEQSRTGRLVVLR